MKKRTNIAGDATRMAHAASADLTNLQRAMRAAEDNLAGLHRMLKVPNTTPRRHTIRKSTSGGFAKSAAQIAADISKATTLAQRIL